MFCVDIGAPKSVIGITSLREILKEKEISLQNSASKFRFGNNVKHSLGSTVLELKPPVGNPPLIMAKCGVVNVDIPPLLGLDVLDKHCLVADTAENQLTKKTIIEQTGTRPLYVINDWKLPTFRRDSHVYVGMKVPPDALYTRQQLEKIHKNFFYPSVQKLFNF